MSKLICKMVLDFRVMLVLALLITLVYFALTVSHENNTVAYTGVTCTLDRMAASSENRLMIKATCDTPAGVIKTDTTNIGVVLSAAKDGVREWTCNITKSEWMVDCTPKI